ncbi:BZ3500_MvSof-1268-A1-R1_Chr11-3g03597 [Microbotryum saponariae]|uniref:BZ3500_MvSof-1268-A1-R1_Chr11-3g03597 protein n=1 Tax=Microbotryum saponariae TaxID=289078 RepID=A0A2X0NE52_9BASI|nr:BZ3500_MvSof-1268-A1-R1_Chr11-3g03597 [Microbotryum saponariae]SDA03606.1 BZ3501_MvSof-1269-A2-R1_Chr11g03174 [Microbotryum saponariae]
MSEQDDDLGREFDDMDDDSLGHRIRAAILNHFYAAKLSELYVLQKKYTDLLTTTSEATSTSSVLEESDRITSPSAQQGSNARPLLASGNRPRPNRVRLPARPEHGILDVGRSLARHERCKIRTLLGARGRYSIALVADNVNDASLVIARTHRCTFLEALVGKERRGWRVKFRPRQRPADVKKADLWTREDANAKK